MGCAGPSHLLAGRFPGGRPPGGRTGPDPAQARIRGRGVTARLHKTLPAPNALTEVRPHTSAEWRTAVFRVVDHWRHGQNNRSRGRRAAPFLPLSPVFAGRAGVALQRPVTATAQPPAGPPGRSMPGGPAGDGPG